MTEKVWFVVPIDAGWVVRERTDPRGEVLPTREAAIVRARELASEVSPARYMVRRADGTIESNHLVRRTQSGVIAAVGSDEVLEGNDKVG